MPVFNERLVRRAVSGLMNAVRRQTGQFVLRSGPSRLFSDIGREDEERFHIETRKSLGLGEGPVAALRTRPDRRSVRAVKTRTSGLGFGHARAANCPTTRCTPALCPRAPTAATVPTHDAPLSRRWNIPEDQTGTGWTSRLTQHQPRPRDSPSRTRARRRHPLSDRLRCMGPEHWLPQAGLAHQWRVDVRPVRRRPFCSTPPPRDRRHRPECGPRYRFAPKPSSASAPQAH